MVKQVPVGGYDSNFSYFIVNEKTGSVAIVDPVNVEMLEEWIQSNGWIPLFILLTHSHHDHVEGVDEMAGKYELPIYMHANAVARVKTDAEVREIGDGDVIEMGDVKIEVMHTPGHIDDSVCYLVGDELITGDTVFVEGCGRADFPNSSVEDFYKSLQRIKQLPDDTAIYPGHNYGSKPVSDIAWEKKHNKYFLCESFEEFRDLRIG